MPSYPSLRILLLSNGYGEDSVGALLGRALLETSSTVLANAPTETVPNVPADASNWPRAQQGYRLELQAFPSVDRGEAYETLGIPILGPRRRMPSGGLLMHSPQLFWGDMRAGFPAMTWQQLRDLQRIEADAVLVIGDVYALALSLRVPVSQRFYVQTLVSVHHQPPARRWSSRYFMEHFSALERSLCRRFVRRMYLRDEATADYLQRCGLQQACALGNPMLDGLQVSAQAWPLPPLPAPVVALLPGSRRYTPEALQMMLRVLEHWPQAHGLVAWTLERAALPALAHWQRQSPPADSRLLAHYQHRERPQQVYVMREAFAEILQRAQLVLGTAGTAHEQAAALGLPVVSFALPPHYSAAFLANQQRLLADALSLCPADPEAIAARLRYLWQQPQVYAQASRCGQQRMGAAGGSRAIAEDVLEQLRQTL